jgi:D-glycero-alpha-D-manno-heptose-7-phosphate kinase
LLLFYTGTSRLASEVAADVVANLSAKHAVVRRMRAMVDEGLEILTGGGGLDPFGELLHEAWALKRQLSTRVASSAVEDVYETAMKHGALGGKLLGAGGGGFVLLFVRPEDRVRVCDALRTLITVPFRFDMSGCRIALYQPDGL